MNAIVPASAIILRDGVHIVLMNLGIRRANGRNASKRLSLLLHEANMDAFGILRYMDREFASNNSDPV